MEGTLAREHVSMQDTLACDHLGMQDTLTREQVSTPIMLAPEHVFSAHSTQFSIFVFNQRGTK